MNKFPNEHGEIMRRDREEREHLDKCIQCSLNIQPLYLQLWPNARVGVDSHVIAN